MPQRLRCSCWPGHTTGPLPDSRAALPGGECRGAGVGVNPWGLSSAHIPGLQLPWLPISREAFASPGPPCTPSVYREGAWSEATAAM